MSSTMKEYVQQLPDNSRAKIFYRNLLTLSFADLEALKNHFIRQKQALDISLTTLTRNDADADSRLIVTSAMDRVIANISLIDAAFIVKREELETPLGTVISIEHTIGTLDTVISQFLDFCGNCSNGVREQTLKHHAEDMIGAGQKGLELLNKRG